MTEIHSFGNLPVIAHAWNKDRTRMLVLTILIVTQKETTDMT